MQKERKRLIHGPFFSVQNAYIRNVQYIYIMNDKVFKQSNLKLRVAKKVHSVQDKFKMLLQILQSFFLIHSNELSLDLLLFMWQLAV